MTKKVVKLKKIVPAKIDGLSPKDLQKLRNACRQIWHRSFPRKLCVSRAIGKDGFPFCEKCKKRVPKVKIDHIEAVGDLINGGIVRMFCPSSGLQALCDSCHRIKTKKDNAKTKRLKIRDEDFY